MRHVAAVFGLLWLSMCPTGSGPMDLEDIRAAVVQTTGDNSLVGTQVVGEATVPDYTVDGSGLEGLLDRCINDGIRWVADTCPWLLTESRVVTTLWQDNWFLDLYPTGVNVSFQATPRTIDRVQLSDGTTLTQLTKKSAEWLERYYAEPFINVASAEPLYWARPKPVFDGIEYMVTTDLGADPNDVGFSVADVPEGIGWLVPAGETVAGSSTYLGGVTVTQAVDAGGDGVVYYYKLTTGTNMVTGIGDVSYGIQGTITITPGMSVTISGCVGAVRYSVPVDGTTTTFTITNKPGAAFPCIVVLFENANVAGDPSTSIVDFKLIPDAQPGDILILPPADKEYTATIYGTFYPKVLTHLGDTNWFTLNRSDLVIYAAAYKWAAAKADPSIAKAYRVEAEAIIQELLFDKTERELVTLETDDNIIQMED